ncbi:tRNA uridine 5-oxyacetic acid(34) methyltransferase CmoM [Cronobacter turicensis]|nr:tRNA uridine 5-oxyacetic acid(34) methyltransferase CmoM [Cronobacter turicensis]ELY4130359.1 tRNA uridine 5-oxyacetic acid(34) methyltransferase CmoM [Cronobacter turicensis]ELY4352039.1 tRNA uridine 5-oxyacetic acid(34) methyltransferase CmoM [Cronobacter turicensis]ELY6278126.1 tRNA uridine 5-oxyacetic acid(34) methyltransferase CmoM [Cronobacter turicensis]
MRDRNFDDIAEKFARNIYGTTKGQLRQAILWQDLDALLSRLPDRPLRVLDAGGGEGQTACRLAERGHQVMLCDLSAEMIARASKAAQEKGVSGNMHFVQCAAQEAGQHLESPVDLILFHAVLEWVADPQAALRHLWQCLAPGGALSLMFYNANGLLMHNMVAGNFAYVQQGMPKKKKRTLSPDYPREPQQVYRWLEEMGWQIHSKTGVRVFHDYLREKHQQRDEYETLLELETRYCRQEPWVSLGRYIHVTAFKPEIQG